MGFESSFRQTERKLRPEEYRSFPEKIGEALGSTIGKKAFEFLRKLAEQFDITIHGLENLQELTEECFLLASNHLKPEEKTAEQSAVSADAFILTNIIRETIGKNLRIVNKSDNGWWSDTPLLRTAQKKFGQPFGIGFTEGIGNIPVQKNPGSFNKVLLERADETENEHDPILIFPEGMWYDDFSPDHTLHPGAAHIAKRLGIKILPVYIRGATSWNKGQEVEVSFGVPFGTETFSKEEITERIREEISSLQEKSRTTSAFED